jgi:hypothetical protein
MGGTQFPGGYAPYPHGEQTEGLAPPLTPRGSREPGEEESPCAPGQFFPKHRMLRTLLLAT